MLCFFFPKQFAVGFSLRKKGWPQYALAASPELVRHVSFGPPCVVGFGCAFNSCSVCVRHVSATCSPNSLLWGSLSQQKKLDMRWPRPQGLSVMWPPCVRLESALATPPNLVRNLSAM